VFIQFAFAGDMLGLGYLENHTRSARAIGETQVTCLPLSAVDNLVEASPLADQLKEAIDHELDFVREGLARSGQTDPMVRVAAFLVALSRGNAYEGRNPNVVDDTVKCGVVASYLGLSVEALARILVQIEDLGLIENCSPAAIRLKDIGALEQLADRRAPIAELQESKRGAHAGF
jgi:CRP/FNR family transcriptional regulator